MATLLANLLVSATGIDDDLSVDDAALSRGVTRSLTTPAMLVMLCVILFTLIQNNYTVKYIDEIVLPS